MNTSSGLYASVLNTIGRLIWLVGFFGSVYSWFIAQQLESWFAARVADDFMIRLLTSGTILSFVLVGTAIYAVLGDWSEQVERAR